MNKRYALTAILLLVAVSLAADKKELKYLRADAVDVVALLPDPPAAGSAEDRRELQEILEIQHTRSADEINRAKAEHKLVVFAFSDVLGEWLTEGNCPKAAKLFDAIADDSKYFSKLGKAHWDRPRPPIVDGHVQAIVEAEKEGSYPSGHATRGIMFALVLSEIFPEHREKLIARGQQIGWDRVIAGVHYPSDIYAGRMLGQALAQKLLADDEFRKDLKKVHTELSKACQLTPAATISPK
jgi:acid phosphatase (class A)